MKTKAGRVPATILTCLSLYTLGGALGVQAQSSAGANIEIALVTFGPGEIYWERFGHNGIWVRDPELGIDSIFDYGRFSFAEPGFLWNFVKGRMEYSIGSSTARRYLDYYRSVDRTIAVQELNLTPSQKVGLRDFLLENNRPENRRYRYHYFYDNCSTRLRDAIDSALGGALRVQLDTVPVAATFRDHALRLSSYNPLLYTGLLLGLGSPTDRELSASDESFIPMRLMEHIRSVTNTTDDGRVVPLVSEERILYESTRTPPGDTVPRWLFGFLGMGVVVAGLMTALAVLAARGPRLAWPFTAFAIVWCLVTGLGGSLLAFLWIFTDHDTSYWNENLFLLTPLALPIIVALPLALRGVVRATRWTVWCAGLVVGSSILGFALQLLPWFNQANGQAFALLLPPNVVLLACIIAVLGHPDRSQFPTSSSTA